VLCSAQGNGPAFDREDAHQGQARRITANFAKLSELGARRRSKQQTGPHLGMKGLRLLRFIVNDPSASTRPCLDFGDLGVRAAGDKIVTLFRSQGRVRTTTKTNAGRPPRRKRHPTPRRSARCTVGTTKWLPLLELIRVRFSSTLGGGADRAKT